MKKTLLAATITLTVLCGKAEFTGDSYYRVQNLATERWCSVIDDKGSINYATTSADLHAIRLQKNFDVVCSDPASIVRITSVGSQINIEAQGVSIRQIIGHYADLTKLGSNGGETTYRVSGTYNGFTKYLGDGIWYPVDLGSMQTNMHDNYLLWKIFPLDENSANFFGVKPQQEATGKYYATMYADFPFSTLPNGVKAYYISGLHEDMACMEPLEGPVAASVPLIFECSSESAKDNMLHIENPGAGKTVTDNKLTGRYICYTESKRMANTLKYDPNTMRVLGLTSNGELGFITDPDLELIPANTCYLKVAPGSPAEYRCVSKEEYMADVTEITIDDSTEPHDVYDIHGNIVLHKATPDQIDSLPHGLYIVNGKKVFRF